MDPLNNTNSFVDLIKNGFMDYSSIPTLSVIDIILAMGVSLICSLIICWTYINTYQGILFQKSFNVTIIMVSLVTTAVIMVISGNLVLSLGMVGALSIIRFRAAIKDPLDIVYLFWAVAIGIANGILVFKISIISSLIIAFILVIIVKIPISVRKSVFVINCEKESEQKVINEFNKFSKKFYIKSKNQNNNEIEFIIESSLDTKSPLQSKLSEINGVKYVNVLSYSGNALDN